MPDICISIHSCTLWDGSTQCYTSKDRVWSSSQCPLPAWSPHKPHSVFCPSQSTHRTAQYAQSRSSGRLRAAALPWWCSRRLCASCRWSVRASPATTPSRRSLNSRFGSPRRIRFGCKGRGCLPISGRVRSSLSGIRIAGSIARAQWLGRRWRG